MRPPYSTGMARSNEIFSEVTHSSFITTERNTWGETQIYVPTLLHNRFSNLWLQSEAEERRNWSFSQHNNILGEPGSETPNVTRASLQTVLAVQLAVPVFCLTRRDLSRGSDFCDLLKMGSRWLDCLLFPCKCAIYRRKESYFIYMQMFTLVDTAWKRRERGFWIKFRKSITVTRVSMFLHRSITELVTVHRI